MSLPAIFGFQFGLVVLALILGLVFRLDLAGQHRFDLAALNLGVLGTLPMLVLVWAMGRTDWSWVHELQGFMREIVVPMFRNAPAGTLFLVSLLAGVGEEWLFRGVVQGGLSSLIGPWAALVVASVLFGALHALSRAYFIVATLMGFYLGLIYLWTGNLLIPILIHFLYDWVVLRYYLGGRAS